MIRASVSDTLQLRQLIPPLTARTIDGTTVRAWDYKQKRNLLIVFLHADCARCRLWLTQLTARAADFAEHESICLLVFLETPPPWAERLPPPLLAAADAGGRSQCAFLGKDAFGPAGLDRVGVFVTDRYGELHAQWIARDAAAMPSADEILKPLRQIQMAC